MKRIVTVIYFLALAASLCKATPVSYRQARDFAERYFGNPCEVVAADGDSPTFYIVNNPGGGWIILSGEDCLNPVLAYSDTGSADLNDMPRNTRAWLSAIDRGIRTVRGKGLVQTADIRQKWSAPSQKTRAAVSQKVLKTANWSQGEPFNLLCPVPSAGCVAVSMAILLRYHKWPEHGNGELETYTTRTEKLEIKGYSLDEHFYNWDNMPLTYDGSSSKEEKDEVSKLVYDCGVMVKTDYFQEGSSAWSEDIIPALAKHMYYSADARELRHENYTDAEWFEILKREIDLDRPFIYGGVDPIEKVGHSFICDGYNSNGYIHINWGWNGDMNGFYGVTFIGDREETGINHVFSAEDTAIVGLYPDPEGEHKGTTELQLYLEETEGLYGLKLKYGTIEKESLFTLDIGYILNYSKEYGYEGSIKAVLVDKKGGIKEEIGPELPLSVEKATGSDGYILPGSTSILDYECFISSDIELGDAVAVFYSLPDGTWEKMGGQHISTPTISCLGVYDACFLRTANSYVDGNVYYIDLIPGRKCIKNTILYLDNVVCIKGFAELSSGTHELKLVLSFTDGSTETLVKAIKVN